MNDENRKIRPIIIIIVVVITMLIIITELQPGKGSGSLSQPTTVENTTETSTVTSTVNLPKALTLEQINSLPGETPMSYVLEDDTLVVVDTDTGETYKTTGISDMYTHGVITNYKVMKTVGAEVNKGSYIIYITIGIAISTGYLVWRRSSKQHINSYEPSDEVSVISGSSLEVGINEVKGHDEIIEDIQSVIEFIKNPYKYTSMGARLPKGAMLFGPPGTGKTMIAKAIAKEAEVSFLSTSGSDFVEKYVGVGAKRVRELFKEARKKSPCIVFIDEIDAIGRSRGSDENSERDNTLNALLTEMDGFSSGDEIFVLASTNRLDILDPALIRAGRFDKHIAVQLPDVTGRREILDIYAKNKPLDTSIDLNQIAKTTTSFSGADLENLMNEASIQAVQHGRKKITLEDIDTAMYSIQVKGKQKNKYTRSENENKLIAYHEAGHTLASILLAKEDVTKVTIIPSTSGAGGITFTNPKDATLMSKTDLENQLRMLYAGRAAEYILTGNEDLVTTGAHNDIERATSLMTKMVSEFGMFKEFGVVNTRIFPGVDNKIETKVKELSIKYYNESIEFLKSNTDRLDYLAKQLMKYETLYEEQIFDIIGDTDDIKS